MDRPIVLPTRREVFLDLRGEDRALRVSWHHEAGLVVLSLWRDNRCTGTFQLAAEDVPAFVDALVRGLGASRGSTTPQRDAG
jgi:hypothetical protein